MIERLQDNLQATAEDLAPSITLYGLAQPDVIPVDPEEYSQSLDTRLQVERALTKQYRQANRDVSSWSFADGLYCRYGDDRDENIPRLQHPLFPEETAITQAIDRSLEECGDPVVALDFGGGMGLSWMRIAAQPRYRAAIEASRLAMVVTNLGSVPEQSADSEGYTGISRSMKYTNRSHPEYTRDDLRWAQENQGYVQYLDANALELPEGVVGLPDATRLSLADNVCVIHERLALAHAHAPDIALASFNELLNDRGVLRSDAATYYHLPHPELFSEIVVEGGRVVTVTKEYVYQRRLGLVVGSMMLRQNGFSYGMEEQRHMGVFTRLPHDN